MDNNINFDADVDIDINFDAQFTTARQVLLKYTNAIQALRLLAEQKYHVRPYHFDNYLLFKYFQQSNNDVNKDATNGNTAQLPPEPLLTSLLKIELLKHIQHRRRQIIYWLSYFLVASILFFAYRQDGMIQDQNLMYPSMRIWRRLTLPLIQRFPRLTELYDESCLMENPFFQVEDLNCEPCAYVDSVLELLENGDTETGVIDRRSSSSSNNKKRSTELVPFVFKINQSSVHLQNFFSIYIKNQEIFRRDAYRVQSTNRKITNLEELFYHFNNSNDVTQHEHSKTQTHSLWRCNRMLPARLLRPLFASSRLPTTGIALERYVSFDTPKAPSYTLPDTECSNVYVQQLLGTRFIVLRPTSECRHRCRTLSIRLPQSFVLSYNWWYWKPISAPDPVAETSSISLIGSYC